MSVVEAQIDRHWSQDFPPCAAFEIVNEPVARRHLGSKQESLLSGKKSNGTMCSKNPVCAASAAFQQSARSQRHLRLERSGFGGEP